MEEHKLKARPYSDEEAKKILTTVMSAETTDWHYNTHHKGYIVKRNEIEKKLFEKKTELLAGANANYSEFGELKRRETFNANGSILHDLFWENLGGNGNIEEARELKEKIISDFGSVEEWKADIKAVALSAKNSGWAVLALDTLGGNKLRNFLVDEHGIGAVWAAIPLIALDVYEHAYYHKDGPKRAIYIDNFISNINWKRVEEKYKE
ncbi:MAG: superoxide dismutase [archaeon]|jgi:Fe-Mn family superoxide dismutase